MKIGKATEVRSAICTADADTIVVRGEDLCRDLIGKVSLTEFFHLSLTGRRATPAALARAMRTASSSSENASPPCLSVRYRFP